MKSPILHRELDNPQILLSMEALSPDLARVEVPESLRNSSGSRGSLPSVQHSTLPFQQLGKLRIIVGALCPKFFLAPPVERSDF